jgi:hypothetical protein
MHEQLERLQVGDWVRVSGGRLDGVVAEIHQIIFGYSIPDDRTWVEITIKAPGWVGIERLSPGDDGLVMPVNPFDPT